MLCHSVGAPQVQADAPSDQGGTRLVRPATSGEPPALRPLATMSWQRPNIGSRVNREVHARFWERLGGKLLRATRQCRRQGGFGGSGIAEPNGPLRDALAHGGKEPFGV